MSGTQKADKLGMAKTDWGMVLLIYSHANLPISFLDQLKVLEILYCEQIMMT